MRKVELLAPAKNLETGIAAVNYGADAVYIGPERFGARFAAGNSIDDIEKLIKHAHLYDAKVFATVNTLLYEDELEDVRGLVVDLYNRGIDGVIIQDMALLEMDLPPVNIHLSTQTNNYDIERIKFLDKTGVSRIVLARELSLPEIAEIRKSVKAELEFFIHGALCVSLSGQCYMSASMGGRSGNRGECAQPCRKEWELIDASGDIIVKKSHLLSLKDLSHSERIESLIDSGVDSLKIEGRLKDINYVKNIVAFYRRELDSILEKREDLNRASSGRVTHDFTPDPERTFNRGYTSYFINGRKDKVGSPDTPKSRGMKIGTISEIKNKYFKISGDEKLSNGDGLSYFDASGTMKGMRVNRVDRDRVFPLSMDGLFIGALLYRNMDAAFEKKLSQSRTERKIDVKIDLSETDEGFSLAMTDEDGISVMSAVSAAKENAEQGEAVFDRMRKQLSRLGDTIFKAEDVSVNLDRPLFIPVTILNDLRRSAAEKLIEKRLENHVRRESVIDRSEFPYPGKTLDYTFNVTNSLSRKFYERHGADSIEDGFEISPPEGEHLLMTTKMCIKHERGLCPVHGGKECTWQEPVFLSDRRRKFRVEFDCARCFMKIYG